MAVVPVYNMITVPDSNLYLQTEVYRAMTGRAPVENEKVTVIVAKKEAPRREQESDSFYPIGVSGQIREVNEQGYLVIRLKARVNLDEVYVFPDKTIELTVSRRADVEDLDPADAALRLTAIKEELLSFSRGFEWGEALRSFVAAWDSIGDVGAGMSPWMTASNEARYALLAEDSQKARFDALEALIYENLELARVRLKAQSAQRADHEKLYKEQALRKQIEYLQQELDELLSLNVSITVGHAVAYRDIYPNIPAGTKFEDLPDDWRCPRCNTMK